MFRINVTWDNSLDRRNRRLMNYHQWFGNKKRLTAMQYYEFFELMLPKKFNSAIRRQIADFTGSFYLKNAHNDRLTHLFIVGPFDSPYAGHLMEAIVTILDDNVPKIEFNLPDGIHPDINSSNTILGRGDYWAKRNYFVEMSLIQGSRQFSLHPILTLLLNIERNLGFPSYHDPASIEIHKKWKSINPSYKTTGEGVTRAMIAWLRQWVKNTMVRLYSVPEDELLDKCLDWVSRGYAYHTTRKKME